VRRAAALLGCLLAVLAVAWYVGTPSAPSPPALGSVRLGPESGERVADYLARLPAELPAPGVEAFALVQFAAELTPPAALAAVDPAVAATAVLQVPLPRVQTALRFEPLEPDVPAATALDNARGRAQQAAAADATRSAGRAAAVAAAEAEALADPTCRCVLALLVGADRAGLEALADRAEVRAVHAAPAGVAAAELALAPLLPGQVDRVVPLPDDGPVGAVGPVPPR
jgi:hypothetical protein